VKKKIRVACVLVAVVLAGVGVSFAADYPTKAITLINPQAPGGTLDIQARAFASVAEKILGAAGRGGQQRLARPGWWEDWRERRQHRTVTR